MHMYKVLAARSKGLDDMRRTTTHRVVDITQRMMSLAMENEVMFQVSCEIRDKMNIESVM